MDIGETEKIHRIEPVKAPVPERSKPTRTPQPLTAPRKAPAPSKTPQRTPEKVPAR
jgi:hypothetical protein